MDENHQDKTESELTATEDKLSPPPLSTKDHRGPHRPQDNRMGAIIKSLGFFGYDKETKEYTPDGQLAKITKEHQPGKTFWDWLQLVGILLIPLVIFLATMRFNQQQADLANQQHQADQQIANDQQREATLQTYLNDMSNLLLNNKLLKSKPGDVERQVARERTLTTLRRLKADRNRIVLQFLRDAHLIGIQDAVIDLSNADLSNDDLSGTDLSGVNLRNAILNGADLSSVHLNGTILNGADLSGADLNGTIMGGVDLSGAHLNGAHLNGANLSNAALKDANLSNAFLNGAHLNGATLNGANLSNATLDGAILSGAILNGAILSNVFLDGAYLSGADLSGADLIYAHLSGADLSDATLDGAYLSGADLNGATLIYAYLSGADLSGATLDGAFLSGARNLTQQQLDKVYSCTNAILSTGLTCHHNQ